MALVSLRQLLDHAGEHAYGLPAFNVNNLEQMRAIMMAADQTDSPVIVQAVGHQPWIGQLCAYLLNRCWTEEPYWSVKKSGIWWFQLDFDAEGRPEAKLKAAITPQMLLT